MHEKINLLLAVWNWKEKLAETQRQPPTAMPFEPPPTRNKIRVDSEKQGLYATIDTDSNFLLKVDIYDRRETEPVAPFLHRLTDKYDVGDAEFLGASGGKLTALARRELSGQIDYSERNHIEREFHTVAMPVDHFHAL